MISDAASLFLFAVRSTVKLSQQVRLAYVDSTRRRELTLPLPKFFSGTTEADAADFFQTDGLGKQFQPGHELPGQKVPSEPRLPYLLTQFRAQALTPAEKQDLINLHVKYQNILKAQDGGWAWNGDSTNGYADPDEVFALLSVQQWQKGLDATPSTLQRVAGTLLEIGIDYAVTTPDLFDKNSRKGKALVGFLNALDETPFAEADISEIPARLFVAVLETASEHGELVSGDPKVQEFVQVTTDALSRKVAERLKAIESDPALDALGKRKARSNVQDWTELVFRGALSSGGRLVLSDPGKFLGVKGAGGQTVVAAVGNSVLDLVLAEGAKPRDVLSRQGVETILKAALKAASEHPEILTRSNNQGLTKLLGELAGGLAATNDLLSLDVFPEIARMALERTGANLELFWPDLENHPERNLLVTAAKSTLAILSKAPAAGDRWRVRFSPNDLLGISETVLDELVANPGWLVRKDGVLSDSLEQLLTGVLNALRQRADTRLSAATAVKVIQTVLGMVVSRQEFLLKLPSGQPLAAGIVSTVLETLFDPGQSPAALWRLASAETVSAIMEAALLASSKHRLGPATLDIIATTLKQELTHLTTNAGGFEVGRFAALLETAMAT